MTTGFSTSSSRSWLATNCGWSEGANVPGVHAFALAPLLYDYSPVQRDAWAPQPRPPLLPRSLIISTGYFEYYQSGYVVRIPSTSPHVLNHPSLIRFSVQMFLPDVRSQTTPFSPSSPTPIHSNISSSRSVHGKLIMHRRGCIPSC